MARLTLRLEDRVLREYAIGTLATIGRVGDNTIVIDSPAVSSHHASVFNEGGLLAVEDLQSTNGTFVNGVRVSRRILKDGDVLQVGQHQLVLDQMAGGDAERAEDAGAAMPTNGETIFIDKRTLVARLMQSETEARKYDALLARLKDVETRGAVAAAAPQEPAHVPTAVPPRRRRPRRSDALPPAVADVAHRQGTVEHGPPARLVQAAAGRRHLAQSSGICRHLARRRRPDRQQTPERTPRAEERRPARRVRPAAGVHARITCRAAGGSNISARVMSEG